MEYYKVFMEVIIKEINRFQLDIEICPTYLNQLTCSLDQNFDVPYNRCAFMIKYGINNTYFFKDCINQFLLDSNAKDILSEWKSHTEVNIFSLSVGPGLDYLAFMLAILEYDSSPPNFTGAKIISRHGAWRNTVNFLSEAFCEQEQNSIFNIFQYKLKYDSVKIIQADFLTYFSGKFTIASLSDAHIVLMVRSLNLQAAGTSQEVPLLQMLKVLISSLRSDATIFCVDTKPSLALFTQAFSNFPGRFLYAPIHRTTTIPVDFPDDFGSRPTVNGRGTFFVWQKLATNLSTSHLDATSVSTECESNSKVAYGSGDDISNLSDPCSLGNKPIIEDGDSVNLPWIELKTFWKSSSPKMKKILKELMLSDKERLESIGEFISQSKKVDMNMPVNTTLVERLNNAEPFYSQNPTLPTVSNLKNMTNDCSYSLVDCNSFDDIVRSSPIDTINNDNSLIYENITLPGTIEVNTSVLSSREKLNTNYDAPVKIQSIKSKSDSEEYTIMENIDAGISSHGKVILTNSLENTSSTSIKDLTDCIRQLVSSLESMTPQNEPPNNNTINGSSNRCHSQNHPTPNSSIPDVPSCSKSSPNFESTAKDNLATSECTVEKHRCMNYHCSCHNRCYLMQLNCQRSCSYFQRCCSLSVPRCSFSCCRQPSKGNLEDLTSPTIVIPLQNLSEDALLKIASVLK